MALTHTLKLSAASGSDVRNTSFELSGDSEQTLVLAVTTGTTDGQVDLAFDKDRLKYIYILSDQNVTFETNNAGAPADTISLLANTPFFWTNLYTAKMAVPFSADVTVCFITNASGSTANITIRLLSDATP